MLLAEDATSRGYKKKPGRGAGRERGYCDPARRKLMKRVDPILACQPFYSLTQCRSKTTGTRKVQDCAALAAQTRCAMGATPYAARAAPYDLTELRRRSPRGASARRA